MVRSQNARRALDLDIIVHMMKYGGKVDQNEDTSKT